MSPAPPSDRDEGVGVGVPRRCARCDTEVPAERYETESSVTWIWRCPCGWGSARTASGVVTRARTREAIARAIARLERSED